MRTRILIETVGLPRSGKSSWAMTTGYPVVSPDAIRMALTGQRFVPESEGMVWSIARIMVRALFESGHQIVILDATNVTRKRRAEWLPGPGEKAPWEVRLKVFLADPGTCKTRAVQDGRYDLIPVIDRMADSYEPIEIEEPRLWGEE